LLSAPTLWLAAFCASVVAQDLPDNPDAGAIADSQMLGVVHTAAGVPIPGSTIRITEAASGKAWITWTDEDGQFKFPALPAGHYRVEISQLGFAPATQEADLSSSAAPALDVKLDVGTLSAITAPAPSESAAKSAPSGPPASISNESTKSAPTGPPGSGAEGSAPSSQSESATSGVPASGGRRNGGQGAGGRTLAQGGPQGAPQSGLGSQGGGRRAFRQLGLNGQAPAQDESGMEDQAAAPGGGQLGQAASADAVQMTGTIAMGQMPAEGSGGFIQFGDAGPGGPGGFGQGIPGMPAPGGPGNAGFATGGPVGFGGGPGGPGGGPVVFMRAGGGGGGRGRGPQGPPQGIEALWGVDRLNKLRANRVHFSIYDSYGNSALNARPYSLSEANPPKIASWAESAGMNLGGPLKIPHVYDGTDKTFFYVNFGGSWSRSPVDQFSTVPTAAERPASAGSSVTFPLGSPLYTTPAGLTTTDAAGNAPLTVTDTNGQSLQARQGMIFDPLNHEAFAGNTLTGPFNPVAISLLNYIPAENLAGERLNYHLQNNVPGLSNRLNVNVTHQLSKKLSLQVNYNLSNSTAHSLNNFPGIEGNTYTRGQSAMIGLTQNWTTSLVHTSQFFFSRTRTLGTNGFTNSTDIASQLGITGVSTAPYDYGLPLISFTNFTGLNDPNFSLARSQTYRYVDSLRWIKEKHTLTVGGEVRKMDINRDTDPAPNGQFSFTGGATSLLNGSGVPNEASQTGNDFADFLLGYAGNTKVQFGDTATYFRNWGFIGYATDDWHIVPKFTLTYGVRYEAFTPPTEINGHIANLDVSGGFSNPTCVTPVATNANGLNCAAAPSAALFNGHYNNWAPRLGIAWQPPGKWFSGNHQMTVRGGFSMFYVEAYLNTLAAEMADQPPFATANILSSQTVPTPPLTLQTNLAEASPASVRNTVSVDPNYKVPYAMIWNFGVEYTLAPRMFLEVMYTGTRGVHLDQLFGYTFPASGTAPGAAFTYDTSGAFSNLNSLQVRLQKRMSHGLMFMGRYTFSKSLDDASTIGGSGQTVIQNNADPIADYGLSSFNMTHQFMGMFVYDLPFGDHHRFAAKGWEKSVFGEWRLNGSITANSGTPYTVRVFTKNQACQNVPGVNSERADEIASAALASPTLQEWFNTAAFAVPTACFGDAARNSIIGPGSFNINTGLAKSIFFGRDGLRRLDFVWNASNLLNHPNFSGLSTVLGSTTFGQITSVGAMRSMQFTTRFNF
jgi:trimeric autotransporter adhesin